MPILAPEVAHFPETLFDAPQPETGDLAWCVLHTRPRQEKSLARFLHEYGISFYLPLLANRVRVRNQVLNSYNPLFPGYFFIRAAHEERQLVLGTRRVVATIQVNDQGRLWSDLRQVYRLLGAGLQVTPETRLCPGTPVQIRHGPLMGLKGVIAKSASGNRFVVTVDFIQRGASVVLEDHVLAALPTD